MRSLYVIPARGGSKGIPNKNIKDFAGKPLIQYAIEAAKACTSNIKDILVSTDSPEIKAVAENCGIQVPFLRPGELATDTAGSFEVIEHSLKEAEKLNKCIYDAVVLLQPTSPFRTANHIKEALEQFNNKVDMVMSVKKTGSNPYYVLFEENAEGYLEKSKKANFTRRQDCPVVYEANGAVYVINRNALSQFTSFAAFTRVVPYLMPDIDSLDLDTPADWVIGECLVKNGLVSLNIENGK